MKKVWLILPFMLLFLWPRPAAAQCCDQTWDFNGGTLGPWAASGWQADGSGRVDAYIPTFSTLSRAELLTAVGGGATNILGTNTSISLDYTGYANYMFGPSINIRVYDVSGTSYTDCSSGGISPSQSGSINCNTNALSDIGNTVISTGAQLQDIGVYIDNIVWTIPAGSVDYSTPTPTATATSTPPPPTATSTATPTPTATPTRPGGWNEIEPTAVFTTGAAVADLPYDLPQPIQPEPLTDEMNELVSQFWKVEWISKSISLAMSIPLLTANYNLIQTLLIASAIIFVVRWWMGRGTHTSQAQSGGDSLPPEANKRKRDL